MPEGVDFVGLMKESHMAVTCKSYDGGDVVISQGHRNTHLGIVISGRGEFQAYSSKGQSIWLGSITIGDIFGSEALSGRGAAPYELIAKSRLDVMFVTRSDFLSALQLSTDALSYVLGSLSKMSEQFMLRLIEAQTLTATGRICAELKRQSKDIGIDPGKHIIRPVPIFSELALRVGSTRESVSRTVSMLTKRKIIIRRTGALVIDDPAALETLIR